MFGTCGIRKIFANYDEEDNKFTPMMALELGLSLGTYLQQNNEEKILIGWDVRTTALPIQLAVSSGLIAAGIRVYLMGLVTTPTLCMAIDQQNSKTGLMITASHNPPEYIGIKIFGPHGLGYSPEQEAEIEKIYQSKSYISKPWDEQGAIAKVHRINDKHIKNLLHNIGFQRNRGKCNVVMDPGNGSASAIGPKLLGYMGLRYITLNSQPDGHFPGRLSEPSPDQLRDLINIVKDDNDFELGIAFDGDADRVVFIDEKGEYIEPIRILTLLSQEYIKEKYPDPNSRPKLTAVTPVNSSGVFEFILEPMGVEIFRTKVGDINVSQLMREKESFIGGENCGVYILPEYSGHWGPDSLMAIVMLIKYLLKYNQPLSVLLKDIPEFPYIKSGLDLDTDQIITDADYKNLSSKIIQKLEIAGFTNFRENYVDGLLLQFDQGWLLLRKSGTTPIFRVTAESKSNLIETEKILEIGKTIIRELYSTKN